MDKPVVTLEPTATPVFDPGAIAAPPVPRNPLLTAPVAATLVRLAAPNLLGMIATTAVSIAETAYLGHLGAEPLAAAALVLAFAIRTGFGGVGFSASTFTTNVVVLRIGPSELGIAFVLAVVVGLAGGIAPAWRAARLRPIEALRRA